MKELKELIKDLGITTQSVYPEDLREFIIDHQEHFSMSIMYNEHSTAYNVELTIIIDEVI